MATVGAKVGLTLKLFKDSQYEFIRPEVSIEGIDPSGNVELQLIEASKALHQLWGKVQDEVNTLIIAEMPNVNKEMELQIAKKFRTVDARIDQLVKDLGQKVK
jgi:hypothetical protein